MFAHTMNTPLKRRRLASAFSLLVIATNFFAFGVSADAATLSLNNTVVVVRVGDGTTALTGVGAAVYLEEYAITFNGNKVPVSATHVQTIAVNNAGATGSVTKLTMGGTGSLEGSLSFSTDGQYMMFAGYDSNVGIATAGGNQRRMIGRLDLLGNVTLDGIYGTGTTSTNNAIRTATSSNGGQYWFGQSASPGIAYRTWEGGNNSVVTATSLNTLNTRRLEIFNGQLYVSSASGTIQGVATVGSGTPTTTGQSVTILPGMPTTAGPSSIDFFFADANTLYVADDRTTTSGGLQKWVLSSGSWGLVYTKNIDTTNNTIDNGLRGLTGSVGVDGTVTLFGTSTFGTAGTANFLVGISDTLANTNPASVIVTSLASSASIPLTGPLTTFRGLEDIGVEIPEPASVALLGLAILSLVGLGRRRS